MADFIAGNVAGICGLAVSYPFDTVKVRMQLNSSHYSGMSSCFKQMIRNEGMYSLYRGLTSPALGYGAINSVCFGTYATVANFIRPKPPEGSPPGTVVQLTVGQSSFSGLFAGFASGLVRGPVERVKTLCQGNKKADGSGFYRGSWHCLTHTLKHEGPAGLFRGVWATVAREVPQYAVYYPSYEVSKRFLLRPGQSLDNLAAWQLMLAGGIAGSVQWLPPLYSIDVIKTRIQNSPSGTYSGFWDCVAKVYQAEGITAAYRGLTPALVRAFPLHATIFVVYERVRQMLT